MQYVSRLLLSQRYAIPQKLTVPTARTHAHCQLVQPKIGSSLANFVVIRPAAVRRLDTPAQRSVFFSHFALCYTTAVRFTKMFILVLSLGFYPSI
jgi:hypothetical protein